MPGVITEQGRTSLLAINYILLDLNKEDVRELISFPSTIGTELILEIEANLQYTLGKAHVNQKNHCANRNYLMAIPRCKPRKLLVINFELRIWEVLG